MTVIVCIDDRNGMAFNNRRQSQDKKLLERITSAVSGKRLLMNAYSADMFGKLPQVVVDEDFLNKAESNDICFAENIDVSPYADKIDKIIIYKWNRHYPSDLTFDIPLDNYEIIKTEDFQGNSHDRITKVTYERIN